MLSPKKHLGQNFLTNKSICEKIASCAEYKNEVVIEIGPGMGALTDFILQKEPKILICIEKDIEAFNFLQEKYKDVKNIVIFNKDAKFISLRDIGLQFSFQKCHIIGNLPYNVGTTIVINLMDEIEYIKSIVVMLQKEVIDRILAKERTKEYGRISVLIQSLCNVKKQLNVNKNNFFPVPKVESSVVLITPKDDLISKTIYNNTDKLCESLFENRRKIVFKKILGFGIEESFVINDLNLNKNIRAEELSVEQFVKLAKLI